MQPLSNVYRWHEASHVLTYFYVTNWDIKLSMVRILGRSELNLKHCRFFSN